VIRKREVRNACKILIGNPEAKKPLVIILPRVVILLRRILSRVCKGTKMDLTDSYGNESSDSVSIGEFHHQLNDHQLFKNGLSSTEIVKLCSEIFALRLPGVFIQFPGGGVLLSYASWGSYLIHLKKIMTF
jgi:hypothetical protein